MRVVSTLATILMASLFAAAAPAQNRTLDIYWVDVEGGAATLVISPSGESLLYDAGWENDDRDAKRIFEAARQAGVTRIDHFVLSHFHADHAGGMVALVEAHAVRPLLRSRRFHRAAESALARRLSQRVPGQTHDLEARRQDSA